MAFDSSTACADAPAAPKESCKKKRTNRSAKLKQCKLEARREQWLSQVKSKNSGTSNHVFSPHTNSSSETPTMEHRDSIQDIDSKTRPRIEKCEEHEIIQDIDLESPANSPTRPSSSTTISSKDSIGDGLSCRCSSSSSYSRSFSEEDDEEGIDNDEAVLDDWEAVADALTTKTTNQESEADDRNINSISQQQVQCDSSADELSKKMDPVRPSPMAWRPDDVFRPSSLPSLAKCHSFPANMERHSAQGSKSGWVNVLAITPPSSCPICYEDLDLTDSSFLPCPCGFRLCLFCHKRIQEADGRCPGCRKLYAPAIAVDTTASLARHLTHSCSMISRS